MVYFLSLVLLVSLPFQFALSLGVLGDIPLARIVAAGIVIIFLISVLSRRCWSLPTPFVTGTLLSLLGITLASCLWAARPDLALPKVALLWNLFPLVFVWFAFFQERKQSQILLTRGLLWGATGAAMFGLMIFCAQFVFGVGETFHLMVDRVLPFFLGRELGALVSAYPSLLVNIDGMTVLRVSAFFPDPHVAAYFFGMSGFLALGLARQTGKRRYAFAAATIFLADILTFSRGGYIGLIVGGVVYGLMLVPTMSRVNFRRLAGAALGGVLIFLTFGQSVWSRMITSFSFADASSLERIRLWQEALVAIAQHPVLGVGLGNYIVVARPLYTTGTPFYAHNLYFDIALEIGLLGLFIFLALCLYALGQAFQARHHVPFAPALVAVFVLYLAHSLFETALYSLHVTLMLVFSLALALSFSRFRDTSA